MIQYVSAMVRPIVITATRPMINPVASFKQSAKGTATAAGFAPSACGHGTVIL